MTFFVQLKYWPELNLSIKVNDLSEINLLAKMEIQDAYPVRDKLKVTTNGDKIPMN
jgi:hypothetical protein